VIESLNVEEPAPLWKGIMPDYSLEIIEDTYISTLISGTTGFILVLFVELLIAEAISKKELKNIEGLAFRKISWDSATLK